MRDLVCLHARLAVSDGLTHQPTHPLSPATAVTAVAGRERCAHRGAHLPPGRRSASATAGSTRRGSELFKRPASLEFPTTSGERPFEISNVTACRGR